MRRASPAAAHARRGARAAVLLALLCAANAALTSQQASQWAQYIRDARETSPAGGTAAAALQTALSHDYSTPLDAVLASNVYTGSNTRLRRFVSDLKAGKQVTIVALGGVATNGSDATQPGKTDYFARYINYLFRAFPDATLRPIRATVGLAPSAVVVTCLDRYLPTDADLVLLEMTANDGATMDSSIVNPGQPKAYELLVRKIMSGSRRPAVVLTQTLAPGQGNATRSFFMTPESPHYAAVSGYYNLPYVSLRNALWRNGKLTPSGKMASPQVAEADGSTPADGGHAALADSLVFMTQKTALDLELLPHGEWDDRSLEVDVPPKAMYSGLETPEKVLTAATCSWVRNATVSPHKGCPTEVAPMCKVDYSSWDAIKHSYATLRIPETRMDVDADGHWVPRIDNKLAFISGVVGGVVGGGAILAGLLAYAIIRKRRALAEEDAAFLAKLEGRGSGLPDGEATTSPKSVTRTGGEAVGV